MRSLDLFSLTALSLTLLAACGDDSSPTPSAAAGQTETNSVGGVTGDFGGNLVSCEAVSLELPGDTPAIGVSVDDILLAGTGSLSLPLRWLSACENSEQAKRVPDCQNPDSIAHKLSGTETTLHIEIVYTGEPARVAHTSEEMPVCAEGLRLPVQLRISTDDGVLNELRTSTLATECGRSIDFGLYEPPSAFGGTIADASATWGENSTVELSGGFFRDRLWFDVYFSPEGSSWLLTSDLSPFGNATHDVSRSEAGLLDSVTLPDEACAFGG